MAAEVTVMQPRTVVGVFDDRVDAEPALHDLTASGFEPSQISVVIFQSPQPEVEETHAFHVDETTGILAGGALGGLAGWLIGATAVAVPGLGALLAAGALVAAVGGAGIGAAAGGLIGHLIDAGLSHEEARYYHERVHGGSALVTVRDAARAEQADAILRRHGAHDYHTRPA